MDSSPRGRAWTVARHDEFNGLELNEDVSAGHVGDYDCVIKIEAVSLNFRDLMVAQACTCVLSRRRYAQLK
jgi:hypothetical protein